MRAAGVALPGVVASERLGLRAVVVAADCIAFPFLKYALLAPVDDDRDGLSTGS